MQNGYSIAADAPNDAISNATDYPLASTSQLVSVRETALHGRGVYAKCDIPCNTIVEVAPIIRVPSSQYRENKLQSTIFESYLFTWTPEGDMAMALGLGSLFNHSDTHPNVGYIRDKKNKTIVYTAKRNIEEGEELCIYYGNVTFDETGALVVKEKQIEEENEAQALQSLGGLDVGDHFNGHEMIMPLRELPLEHVTMVLRPEDIPLELFDVAVLTLEAREIPSAMSFLKSHSLNEMSILRQCKRVRQDPSRSGLRQILLAPLASYPFDELERMLEASGLKSNQLSVTQVPRNPARTTEQVREWSRMYWPVNLIPIKEETLLKAREGSWSNAKVDWVRGQLFRLVKLADETGKPDLPVVCTVTETWDPARHSPKESPIVLSQAKDTRNSTSKPLNHAALNLVTQVSQLDTNGNRPSLPGSDYLMTGLTLFITHEPCLFCSMAILHSRINTLIYIKSSPGAGGTGTEYSLHEQKSLNHSFEVWKVRADRWADLHSRVADVAADP